MSYKENKWSDTIRRTGGQEGLPNNAASEL